MAVTPFALIRNAIADITMLNQQSGFQKFQDRISDLNIVKTFFDNTPAFDAEYQTMNQTARTTFAQEVQLRLFQRRQPGTSGTRKRVGSGGSTELEAIFPLFDPIVEEFDISYTNVSRIEGTPEFAKYQKILQRELGQCIINMLVRANEQFRNFLDAEKWALNTLADQGSVYTSYLADAKQVPSTDLADGLFLTNTNLEWRENNFNKLGVPTVIGSASFEKYQQIYRQQGQFNNRDLQNVLNWYNPVIDNNIAVGVNELVYYLVANGGIGAYNWVKDFAATNPEKATEGKLEMGQDQWFVMPAPIVMENQLPFNIEFKYFQSSVDNSGTQGVGAEADPVESWVLTTTFAGMVAPEDNPSESPIIKYEVTP